MTSVILFLRWPVVFGLLAAIIILDYFPALLSGLTPGGQPAAAQASAASVTQGPYSYAEAFNRAAPAVVNIYTSKTVRQKMPAVFDTPLFKRYLEQKNIRLQERIQRSLGSGVIISQEGYILTNYHVIKDADEILVRLQDDREALATVVGNHPETDLAVLKITLDGLNAIPLGNSSQAMIGDVVLAIGNAYGFGHTVTQGIISATGRYGINLNTYENYIQTDAAINPGNSGGALIDARGYLLGINTLIFSKDGGSQGIGLAIPSDLAVGIMSDLVMYGEVIRGWLGIHVDVRPLSDQQSIDSQLSVDIAMIVTSTDPGSPAAQSGLIANDIIIKINGRPVGNSRQTMEAAMQFVETSRPGQKVSIDIVRDGVEFSLMAVLGARPRAQESADLQPSGA
jgi:serine protease DegS